MSASNQTRDWRHLTGDELVAFACERQRRRRVAPTPVARDEVAIARRVKAEQKKAIRRARREKQRRQAS
jgi:hypothetical protein